MCTGGKGCSFPRALGGAQSSSLSRGVVLPGVLLLALPSWPPFSTSSQGAAVRTVTGRKPRKGVSPVGLGWVLSGARECGGLWF